MSTVIMNTATRIVVPIIFVISLALFLQGHNLPGGGFIAGVLTTTAFALIYVTFGISFLEEQVLDQEVGEVMAHLQYGIVARYRLLFAAGLLLAVVSGLVPMVFVGDPFMSQYFTHLEHLPVYGDVEVASAVAFDLGVYVTVVGALLTILSVVGAE